jgi:hypothetical protein
LDLLRDSRIVVHSVTSDREGTEGDVKLYGRAIDISAGDDRHAMTWDPSSGLRALPFAETS